MIQILRLTLCRLSIDLIYEKMLIELDLVDLRYHNLLMALVIMWNGNLRG